MKVSVVTLFPEIFEVFAKTSMVGRACMQGALELELIALREFGLGKHKSVDDTPYGGGSGMVLRLEPVVAALESVDASACAPAHRVHLTPRGRPFDQHAAERLSALPHVALVCGRYEGFDDRLRHFIHEEVSLGDFVMTGGEVAAMAIIEATARLLPNVLGNEGSSEHESFSASMCGGLEYPHFTRPVEFRGHAVPAVLSSGDHKRIEQWRREESARRTEEVRPDLLPTREKGG